MVLDFFRRSTVGAFAVTGVTFAGGSGMGGGSEAVLRVSGSTGGTIGADFFNAAASGATDDRMAAVLLGIRGRVEVGEIIGGTTEGTTEVVRRVIGGGVVTGVGAASLGGASGGGVAETRGGGAEKADMMGDDCATGSGMFAPGAGTDSKGGAGTNGGWGASGSGVRVDFASAMGEAGGSGGIVVRAVSARPGESFRASKASLVIVGSVPVVGSAGGRARCSTGSRFARLSVLPLTKTLACGLAMMTRGGAETRPEALVRIPEAAPGMGGGGMFGGVASGMVGELEPRLGTSPVSGGALTGRLGGEAKVARSGSVLPRGIVPGIGAGTESGSVFAREPVSEADCFSCDGAGPTRPVGGRVGRCIGWVTAVDQGGGLPPPEVSAALIRSEPFIGIVAAVPGLARDKLVESGLSGRGGNVTRRVSRFCG
jgi:hypothetical protein